ncbi:hypothetical protein [Thiolapillus sp.]
MKPNNLIAATALLAVLSIPAMADSTTMPMKPGQMAMNHDNMQMMKGGMAQGGGMGMMNPEMMKQKQEMMKKHMATMETRLANIEALLKELVELQKKS